VGSHRYIQTECVCSSFILLLVVQILHTD
jgi:hypothetical protein